MTDTAAVETDAQTELTSPANAASPPAYASPAEDAVPPDLSSRNTSEAPPMRRRVREWIRALYRDPSAEKRAIEERRIRLLNEINQAVADAPDDVPIKRLIEQLNRHNDD